MYRGYDSSEVFCEDTLLRIKHLYEDIVAMQKSVQELKPDNLSSQKSNRTAKKESGVGRPPKKRRNDPDPE